VFLKGNHEECTLRFLRDPTVLPEWQKIGGLNTLLPYGVIPSRRDEPLSQHNASTALRRAMSYSRKLVTA
jgi:serine/threonine protein phosphatase 1